MNLIPWRKKKERRENGSRPETSLARLRTEIDTLFDRFLRDPWSLLSAETLPGWIGGPRTDLAETDDAVIVTMEVPGVDPKDVDIELSGDLLTVRGEKKAEHEQRGRDYHFVEREFGTFARTIQLPATVDPDKVEATYKNGVLTIRIAKHAEARPKRVKVRHA